MRNEYLNVQREADYRVMEAKRSLDKMRDVLNKNAGKWKYDDVGELVDEIATINHNLDMIGFAFQETLKQYDKWLDMENTTYQRNKA